MKWLSSIKSHDPLVMWSYEIMWQTETSHLHHHNAYDHQTLQSGNLLWRAPTHKVTWPLNYVVLRDNVINQKYYIFTTKRSFTTILDIKWRAHTHRVTWSLNAWSGFESSWWLTMRDFTSSHMALLEAPTHRVIWSFTLVVLCVYMTN